MAKLGTMNGTEENQEFGLDDNLRFSLYENAIDSIQHSIEHFVTDNNPNRRYKYAILHLSQGVLLLLKERLRREHPSLIFSKVHEEKKTVDTDELLLRLTAIARVNLGEDDKQIINDLTARRNQIEHFSVTLKRDETANLIIRAVFFLTEFMRLEFGKNLQDEIGTDTWQRLTEIQEYADNAKREAETTLRKRKVPIYNCKVCQSKTGTLLGLRRLETTNSVRLSDDGFQYIGCTVCLNRIGYIQRCRRCKDKIERICEILPVMYYGTGYCSKCSSELYAEYPEVLRPELANEVRMLLLERKTLRSSEIGDLSFYLYSSGPMSRGLATAQLIQADVLEFVYDWERLRCEEAQLKHGMIAGPYPDDTLRLTARFARHG